MNMTLLLRANNKIIVRICMLTLHSTYAGMSSIKITLENVSSGDPKS